MELRLARAPTGSGGQSGEHGPPGNVCGFNHRKGKIPQNAGANRKLSVFQRPREIMNESVTMDQFTHEYGH